MKHYKNLKNLNLIELRESLDRINSLLNKTNILNKLTDKGVHLKEAKERFEKEIAFREDLDITNNLMSALTINTDKPSHLVKMCMIEKSPQQERFKPSVGVKPISEPKVQLIDLKTSLDLQLQQEDRVKAELKSNLLNKTVEENIESDDEDGEASESDSSEDEVVNENRQSSETS